MLPIQARHELWTIIFEYSNAWKVLCSNYRNYEHMFKLYWKQLQTKLHAIKKEKGWAFNLRVEPPLGKHPPIPSTLASCWGTPSERREEDSAHCAPWGRPAPGCQQPLLLQASDELTRGRQLCPFLSPHFQTEITLNWSKFWKQGSLESDR